MKIFSHTHPPSTPAHRPRAASLAWIGLVAFAIMALLVTGRGLAQSYLFSLDEEVVDVYWNTDGTVSLDYLFTFTNAPNALPIDFVDVGIPNGSFNENDIYAEINGQELNYISRSEFQGNGTGVAVGLEQYAIQPGKSGTLRVYVPQVGRMVYPDNQNDGYVSGEFIPTWFGKEFVQGATDMTVRFHFPAEVQPDEPRWHKAPSGFPAEPETGFDEEDRVTYVWHNPTARAYERYVFGASFPGEYVPEEVVVSPTPGIGLTQSLFAIIGAFFSSLFSCFPGVIWILVFAFILWSNFFKGRRRRMQYLPPKLAIEGHGIKRGLTAVEAAILLEQPLDKIMTMTLFSVLKKGAAQVVKQEPLELEITDPLSEDLRPYEKDFLTAFKAKPAERRRLLQEMMVNLVKSIQQKMKGFSQRETVAYYRDIVKRAWDQVETAETPEVKSERYNEVMDWTMLDRNYGPRTRDVFRTGPVYVPIWWPRYDPVYRRSLPTGGAGGGTTVPAPVSTGGGQNVSLPHLPGSDFAASVVNGVQNMSAGVIGSLAGFTGAVTQRTNPPPPPRRSGGISSGRGGGGCACACACAGCACACAGGGR